MTSVLALETSCDESAAAVVRRLSDGRFQVVASRIASQVEEHARWGGVVPEIASRRHVEALPVLVEQVLHESKTSIEQVDAVAATVAPGLVGALMVASVTGRTLAAFGRSPGVCAAGRASATGSVPCFAGQWGAYRTDQSDRAGGDGAAWTKPRRCRR